MGASSYDIDVTIGGSQETLAVSIEAGAPYYPTGRDGDLLELIAGVIAGHSTGPSVTGTVAFVGGQPRARFTLDAPATLDLGTLGSALGFSGPVSGTTCTAEGWLPQVWVPGHAISADSRDRRQLMRGLDRAMSGRVSVTDWGETAAIRDVTWQLLQPTVALAEYATTPAQAFETHWVEGISLGEPFRVYEQVAALSSSAFGTYTIDSPDDPLQRDKDHDYRFSVSLQMRVAGDNSAGLTGDEPRAGGYGAQGWGTRFGL